MTRSTVGCSTRCLTSRHARIRNLGGHLALVVVFGLLAAVPARAASLQRVNDWGASGVPSTVSMYIYVPDKLATNPPILVCAHYCGGTAAAVFGQTQGGGIIKAADQYGFIMIFPQAANNDGSGRCWDVGTTKSLTHDGGGDTHAIAQMVKYTIGKYNANPDRVYASGTSSGAMMTEALLATYPDVFKGGVEFAGVPAGCWAVGASADGTWSGPCAGGQVTHSEAEWGDIARKMYPAYAGRRPRIQLWHGDKDGTIKYTNHTEAIKQWTNVLGLSASPTSTTSLKYGSHQWTRQTWQNSCGFTVLDAWTELNGEHGVPDANLNAQYTIPFLGLDKTGPVDPEIAQCSGTGDGGGSDAGGSDGGADGKDAGSGDGSGGSRDGGSADAGGGGSSGGGSSGGGSSGGGSSGGGSSGGGSSGGGSSGGGSSGGGSRDGGSTDAGGSGGSSSGGASRGGDASGSDESGDLSGFGCTLGEAGSKPHLDAVAFAVELALLFLMRRRGSIGSRLPAHRGDQE